MRERGKIEFARKLRRAATQAERVLWQRLRGRQVGGYKFRRQHVLGHFIFDFYCSTAHLAVEVDGAVHTEANQVAYDQERTRYIDSAGVRISRFWNYEVLQETDEVIQRIASALSERDS